jgi:hypothetical protein
VAADRVWNPTLIYEQNDMAMIIFTRSVCDSKIYNKTKGETAVHHGDGAHLMQEWVGKKVSLEAFC